MKTKEFTPIKYERQFRTEKQCINYVFNQKYPDGFNCKKCGCNEYYEIDHRGGSWECKSCRYQESAKKDTLFEGSHLPLLTWFKAIYEITVSKGGISAVELKYKLNIGSYKTALSLLHKLRAVMGLRDEKYFIGGLIELDGASFGHKITGTEAKVYISVESKKNSKGKPCAGFAKAKVIDNFNKDDAKIFSTQNIKEGSVVKTDGGVELPGLEEDRAIIIDSKTMNNDSKKLDSHLPWVHKLISNIKSFIIGTYHGVSIKHLQLYLDEYLYRFNRRLWPKQLQTRLINACIEYTSNPVLT